jgi:hypothetical protein
VELFALFQWFTGWLTPTNWQVGLRPPCHCWCKLRVGGADTKRCAQHFSQASHERVKEEGIWPIDSRSLILAFLCPSSPSLFFILSPLPPSKLQPPPAAMASTLSSSRLRTPEDLRRLRRVIMGSGMVC